MKEQELKPCPFCGHPKPEVLTTLMGQYKWMVQCDKRECRASTNNFEHQTEAIKAWNKRSVSEADYVSRTKPAEMAHLFGELMAIIRGDGGHYLSKHGPQKAYNDAVEKYYETRKDEPAESASVIQSLHCKHGNVLDICDACNGVIPAGAGELWAMDEIVDEFSVYTDIHKAKSGTATHLGFFPVALKAEVETLIDRHNATVTALSARAEEAERKLAAYEQKGNLDAQLASMSVLALDGGRRASKALAQLKPETKL